MPQFNDDSTVELQLQGFLDEWHYRVLHGGLAYTQDRFKIMCSALDVLSHHGAPSDDKELLCRTQEQKMIQELLRRMPVEMRGTFSYYAQQLQLVIATTTRVRGALEVGDPDEVAHIMDDSDAGVTQHILRQAIVEAALEVREINELQESWKRDTAERLQRLFASALEAESCQKEIETVHVETIRFSAQQIQKVRDAMLGFTAASEYTLLQTTFQCWRELMMSNVQDKEFRASCARELEEAKEKLFRTQDAKRIGGTKVLAKLALDSEHRLCEEVVRTWRSVVNDMKEERRIEAEAKEASEKYKSVKEATKANAVSVLRRMICAQEARHMALAVKAWREGTECCKRESAHDRRLSEAERELRQRVAKKSEASQSILARMLTGADQGLLTVIRKAWTECYRDDLRQREEDEALQRAHEKYTHVSQKQKIAVTEAAATTNRLDDLLLVAKIFHEWATEVQLEFVWLHYQEQMHRKKHQLESVQSMFRSFATQLETGITNTPRKRERSNSNANAIAQ